MTTPLDETKKVLIRLSNKTVEINPDTLVMTDSYSWEDALKAIQSIVDRSLGSDQDMKEPNFPGFSTRTVVLVARHNLRQQIRKHWGIE